VEKAYCRNPRIARKRITHGPERNIGSIVHRLGEGSVEVTPIKIFFKTANHVLIVTNEEESRPGIGAKFSEESEGLASIAGIEVARWLVGQYQLGTISQGPSEGHALLLPNGKLTGIMSQTVRKAYPIEQLLGSSLVHLPGKGHGEHDVFETGKTLKKVERLEDVTDCRSPEVIAGGLVQFGHFGPVYNDGSLVRSKYTRQKMKERRLARTTLAPHAEEISGSQGKTFYVHNERLPAIRRNKALA
jgi:hypothetical protein